VLIIEQLKLLKREWRLYLAIKKEVLFFFAEEEIVTIRSLMDNLDYTYRGACERIYLIHREGLIAPLMKRGTWGLTNKGERRLMYYE